MRIVFDARKFQDFGIGRYLSALLVGLPDLAAKFRFELIALSRRSQLDELRRDYAGWWIESLNAVNYSIREQWLIPLKLCELGADLFHASHYATATYVPCPYVVTLHDLIHVLFPQFVPSLIGRCYTRLVVRRVVSAASAVLYVSESTRRELLERRLVRQEVVTVTPNGVTSSATEATLNTDVVSRNAVCSLCRQPKTAQESGASSRCLRDLVRFVAAPSGGGRDRSRRFAVARSKPECIGAGVRL